MMCQMCNQQEATIHLTEIVNEKMVELHICEQCAKEKAVDLSPPVSFNEVLSGLVDFADHKETQLDVKCSECGMTYDEFKTNGRLGCAICYESFQKALIPLIKNIHGAINHLGKRPEKLEGSMKVEMEIKELQERLKKHIGLEEFEEAVGIRDKIKMLEKKLSKEQESS